MVVSFSRTNTLYQISCHHHHYQLISELDCIRDETRTERSLHYTNITNNTNNNKNAIQHVFIMVHRGSNSHPSRGVRPLHPVAIPIPIAHGPPFIVLPALPLCIGWRRKHGRAARVFRPRPSHAHCDAQRETCWRESSSRRIVWKNTEGICNKLCWNERER